MKIRLVATTIALGTIAAAMCLPSNSANAKGLRAGAIAARPNVLEQFDQDAFEIAEYLTKRTQGVNDLDTLDLARLIVIKSAEIDVSPHLLLALIDVESTFNSCAISGVGAKGLMQIMPYRILGRDEARRVFAFRSHLIYDPYFNIAFGAQYLGQLINRFDSVETALAAYNAGPTRIARILREDGSVWSGYSSRVMATTRQLERSLQL